MADYLFMLDSHLDAGQNQAVAALQQIAADTDINAWLTGGAMRDMLRGVPSRDLDFVVERDAVKTGRALAQALSAQVVAEDSLKRWISLEMSGGTNVSVGNARTEKYSKPGGKPQIAPATIQEDLARRDFTVNAIALSLSRRSKGLLIDPLNGQADLAARELRTTGPYAFFDDPARVFRLIRFRHTLGFEIVPRTRAQMENAIAGNYLAAVGIEALAREIRTLAGEPVAAAALQEYDELGLLRMLSPALVGPGLNATGLARFERLKQSVLPASGHDGWLAFVTVLTEKLEVRARAQVVKALELSAEETAALKQLEAQAKKLESALRSARIHRPSDVWLTLCQASTDEILMVLYTSAVRVVQDRIRAFYEKYLPQSREITDEQVVAAGGKPGTPKFRKMHHSMVVARLNARPRKVVVPEPEAAPQLMTAGRGRKQA
jgi:tRNA nucleotidyltransferase/poly(A) polymerase